MPSTYEIFQRAREGERSFLEKYLPATPLKTTILGSFQDGNYNGLSLRERRELSETLRVLFPSLDASERPTALRIRSKVDLFYLCKGILGFIDLEPRTHQPFCSFMEDPRYFRKLAMLPRGYFKTTIGTISRSVQLLINQPTIRILIANATQTNASKFLLKIEDLFLNNELLRALFPELIPENIRQVRWNSTEMELRRPENYTEASVECIGVGGTAVSRHYDVIIKDDLVNEDQLASREQMEKVIEWNRYAESLFINLTKAIDIHVGTRWAYYDVLSHVMETDKSYKVYHLSCWADEGKTRSTFPERFPVEVLASIRERQGRKIFSCQYENDPLPAEERLFLTERVHKWPVDGLSELAKTLRLDYRVNVIVDPALGEKGSTSDSAVLVETWGAGAERVVLEALALQAKPLELIERVLNLADRYELLGFLPIIHFEGVLFQRVLKTIFEDAMVRRGKFYRVEVLMPSTRKSKAQRIETVEAPISAGKMYIREDLVELLNQLDSYPAGKKLDLLDVLAYGETLAPAGVHAIGGEQSQEVALNMLSLDHILAELSERYARGQGLFTGQKRGMYAIQ